MKIPAPCLAGFLAGVALAALPGAVASPADDQAARRALREELATESEWVKVHAAEVLVAYGEADTVRPVFLEELRLHPDQNEYRVGIHRVLARCAPTPAERAAQIEWIAGVFVNPQSRDRGHAVETLAKLGAPHSPAVLAAASEWLKHATEEEAVFIQWVRWESGDESALRFIVSRLRSPTPAVRLRSAYALRLTGTTDPAAMSELACAADAEKVEGDPAVRAIIVGAAYKLQAAADRHEAWREMLEDMVAHGTPVEVYHALQALLPTYSPADLARLRPALDITKADARIATAWAMLEITTRSGARH